MLLLEALAVARAQLHHGLHVDLVEGRENRGRVLCLHQALGHLGAQPRHGHAPLRPIARGDTRCHGRGSGRRARLGFGFDRGGSGLVMVQVFEHVLLENAPVLARALDFPRIESLFRHGPFCRRHNRRGFRCRRRRDRCRRGGGSRGFSRFIEPADGLSRQHRRANRHGYLDEHAAVGRRHFENDLVGFDFCQHVAARDLLARLLAPHQNLSFGNGFRKNRNRDFSCHDTPCAKSFHTLPRAWSSNSCSCLM